MLDASCPWTSDSGYFGFWTLGLTPVVCWWLAGLQSQTDGCAVSFPTFEAFGFGLRHYWLLSSSPYTQHKRIQYVWKKYEGIREGKTIKMCEKYFKCLPEVEERLTYLNVEKEKQQQMGSVPSSPPRGAGKPPPAPGPRQQWGTLARQFPSLQLPALPAGRAGAGTEERGAEGRRLPTPDGWLFIARAARASRSPARLTGPLTRLAAGPSPRGCAPGACDNGLLCVQLRPPPAAGGGGRATPQLPSFSAATPGKVIGLFRSRLGPGPCGLFFFFSYFISKFLLPQAPLSLPAFPTTPKPPQRIERGGSIRPGAPLCAPGERDVPGAPSGGCGDRGAGSAGQVTYPGPRVEGFVWSGRRGAGVGVNAGQPFWDSSPPPPPPRLRAGSQSGCVARRAKEKLLLRD
uniref:translation initiation factor IF-2-like n=1 Tax=Callithrix jacchus TaxID=9483 RepID=UPI0023DD1CBC|nr:translation initiation factor IF-2-like [Callithrix jacchus]